MNDFLVYILGLEGSKDEIKIFHVQMYWKFFLRFFKDSLRAISPWPKLVVQKIAIKPTILLYRPIAHRPIVIDRIFFQRSPRIRYYLYRPFVAISICRYRFLNYKSPTSRNRERKDTCSLVCHCPLHSFRIKITKRLCNKAIINQKSVQVVKVEKKRLDGY